MLLKVVIQAILTYTMSLFTLPRKICKEIASSMSNFWWGHMKKESGDSLEEVGKVRKLGDTKSQGGLGFRNLKAFNKALLSKQV